MSGQDLGRTMQAGDGCMAPAAAVLLFGHSQQENWLHQSQCLQHPLDCAQESLMNCTYTRCEGDLATSCTSSLLLSVAEPVVTHHHYHQNEVFCCIIMHARLGWVWTVTLDAACMFVVGGHICDRQTCLLDMDDTQSWAKPFLSHVNRLPWS